MSIELSVIDPKSVGGGVQQGGTSPWSSWSDRVGMLASVGCAIHCAAMPFVIAYLPAFGLSFLADEAFHKWMAVGCFAIALMAFIPGLRKHERLTPVIIGSFGLVMISVAAFGFAGQCCPACDSETVSVVSGDVNGCTDKCCAHCATEAVVNESTGAGTDVQVTVTGHSGSTDGLEGTPTMTAMLVPTKLGGLGGRIAPWLTPLGGIVLVVAHLLNRRFGCLCGCCETRSVEATA